MRYRTFITLALIGILDMGLVGCRTSGSWTSPKFSESAFNPTTWSMVGPGTAPSQVTANDAPAYPDKPSKEATPTAVNIQTGTIADASALPMAGQTAKSTLPTYPGTSSSMPSYPSTSPAGYASNGSLPTSTPDYMAPQAGPYGASVTPYPQIASNPNGNYPTPSSYPTSPAAGSSYPANNSYPANTSTTPSYAYPGTSATATPAATSDTSYTYNSVDNPYRTGNPPVTNEDSARFAGDPNSRYYAPSSGASSDYASAPTQAMSTTPSGYDYSAPASSYDASSYGSGSYGTPTGTSQATQSSSSSFRPGSTSSYPTSNSGVSTPSSGSSYPSESSYGGYGSTPTTNNSGYGTPSSTGSSYGTTTPSSSSPSSYSTPASSSYPASSGYPSYNGYTPPASYTPSGTPTSSYAAPTSNEVIPTSYNNSAATYIR